MSQILFIIRLDKVKISYNGNDDIAEFFTKYNF